MRRRQRRMRGNLPGPEGLAGRGASAALHGLPVVPPRAAPRALHPLPLLANAAHAEFSDRLLAFGERNAAIRASRGGGGLNNSIKTSLSPPLFAHPPRPRRVPPPPPPLSPP